MLLIIIALFGCKKDSDNNPGGGSSNTSNPLCFTAEENGAKIGMGISGSVSTIPNFEYSFDKQVWTSFLPGATVITLEKTGDKVYFRGNNPNGINYCNSLYDYDNFPYVYFKIDDNKAAVSGNIMSLIDPTCQSKTIPCKGCFFRLFDRANISTAPDLPATELTDFCYMLMFRLSNLIVAPELPAMTMAECCYCGMFAGCEKMIVAPELPATSLAILCYDEIFAGCIRLNSIKVHFTDWHVDLGATSLWVADVSQTGTFYCPSSLQKEFGWDRIPTGWTIETF